MEPYELKNLVQRFAISALSKERKDEALNEEILVGKYTGEFFIKTKDGVVVSTDILNRLKSSTESAIKYAEFAGMTGNLFHIDFDNLSLPTHIDYAVNVIENEPIELPVNIKKLLLNIDYDEYDILTDTVKPVNTGANVKITLETRLSDGTVNNIEIEKSIKTINDYIINLEDLTNVASISIISIVIEKEEKVYNIGATDRTVILHNLFITLDN